MTVNIFEDPGNPWSCPFGSSQPELTYCSLPLMVKFAFGTERFTLPEESITVPAPY